MADETYTVITVARFAPTAQREMMEALGALSADLRAEAGALAARFGIVATGEDTGDAMLYAVYPDLASVERAFATYRTSDAYARAVAVEGLKIKSRDIVRNEDVGLANPSPDAPRYAVMTRWTCADLMLDEIREALVVWEANGATIARYGTLMTGSDVGKRLMTAGFPSMDAIEKTYAALATNETYRAAMARLELNRRDIVRVHG
jgi:hypothetical protein